MIQTDTDRYINLIVCTFKVINKINSMVKAGYVPTYNT